MAFESLQEKLGGVFKKLKGRGKLTEADVKEAMREVKMALLEADVSYKVVKEFVGKVTERSIGEEVLSSLTPAQQVIKIVNEELIALMGDGNSKIAFPNKPPCIIMMCGLQGAGKTTHAAKLAKHFKRTEQMRPLLIAADVYRPAAIEQLKIVGEKAEVPVFEMGQIDPRTIVKEGLKHASDYGNDLVIIDTAGRLHIDEELMQELIDIKKIAQPNEIMLVIDAMIGQDSVKVAESFDNALGIDSVLLTKLDSDTRGGAALSVLSVTGKPIKFVRPALRPVRQPAGAQCQCLPGLRNPCVIGASAQPSRISKNGCGETPCHPERNEKTVSFFGKTRRRRRFCAFCSGIRFSVMEAWRHTLLQ